MKLFAVLISVLATAAIEVYGNQLDYLPNSLIQDFISHIQGDRKDSFEQAAPDNVLFDTANQENFRIRKDAGSEGDVINRYRFQTRDDILLPREPSPRKEYLEHSSLYGHQYVQGGAGEGTQRLKPDGSMSNIQVIKSDSVLPAYCNPPNPCPLGYTAEDGCLDEFANSARFSKDYQSSQECMCDTEHMFSCPGSTDENELETLARSIQNEGLMDSTIDKIMENMQTDAAQHKVVAKKFFIKRANAAVKVVKRSVSEKKHADKSRSRSNPFLMGEKLPVVAKKSPHTAKL